MVLRISSYYLPEQLLVFIMGTQCLMRDRNSISKYNENKFYTSGRVVTDVVSGRSLTAEACVRFIFVRFVVGKD
jgi:hypothetical protein